MWDNIYLGNSVSDYESSPDFTAYTKVIINIDDENAVEAGTDEGRVMELDCPWGTQQMAEDILRNLKSFVYRPYSARGAILDPTAEIGDGVTIGGIYSGIYSQELHFGSLMTSDIEAPQDEAIDHEYPYESKGDRKVVRKFKEVRASLQVNADNIQAEVLAREQDGKELRALISQNATEIAAKVSETGGNASSFGWSLKADGFTLSAGGSEVFKANKSGVEIKGKITALSGFIGNGSKGFTISAFAIYNGLSSFGGSANGVYIGTDGISLGGGKFKVDAAGNLQASSGRFTGNVYANRIEVGGNAGYISGSQIGAGTVSGGNIGYGTISTSNTSGYINGGIADGYDAADVLWNGVTCNYMRTDTLATNGVFAFRGKPINLIYLETDRRYVLGI